MSRNHRDITVTSATAPRWVRVCVWLAFVAALLGVSAAINTTTTDHSPASVTVAAGVGGSPGTSSSSEAALAVGVDSGSPLGRYVKNDAPDSSPLDLLPAWRWQSVELLDATDFLDQTATGGFQGAANGIAEIMFSVTSLIWAMIISVLQYALTFDILGLDPVKKTINTIFGALAGSLWSSGLIMLGLALTGFGAWKMAMKGRMSRAVGMAIAFLVPLAALQMMGTAANSAEAKAGQSPKYSPTWMATKASNIVNTAGTGVLQSVDVFGITGGANMSDSEKKNLSCYQYRSNLYQAYSQADAANTEAGKQSTGKVVSVVSRIWERAFLSNWSAAQYGDTAAANYMYCHQLEIQRNASPSERFALAGGVPAYWAYRKCVDDTCTIEGKGLPADGTAGKATIAAGAYKGMGLRPFNMGLPSANKGGAASVVAWAACGSPAGDGRGARPRDGWNKLNEMKVTDDACKYWATEPVAGATADNPADYLFHNGAMLSPGDPKSLSQSITEGNKNARSASEQDGVREVEVTYNSIWGKNSSTRMFNAMFAFITALLYGYALLGVALGAIIAGIGFALCVAILPVTLVLIAMNRGETHANNPGMKLLKLTGGMAASKLVLVAAISIMMTFIVLIQRIASGGIFGSVITAAAPLIALFIVKAVGNRMGFGNILSAGGAVGLSTAAVLRASGDSRGAAAATSAGAKAGADKKGDKNARKDNMGTFNKDTDKTGTGKKNGRFRRGLGLVGGLAKAQTAAVGSALTDKKNVKKSRENMTDKQQQRLDERNKLATAAAEQGVHNAPAPRDPDKVSSNIVNGASNLTSTPDSEVKTGAPVETFHNVMSSPAAAAATSASATDVVISHVESSGGNGQALSSQQVTDLRGTPRGSVIPTATAAASKKVEIVDPQGRRHVLTGDHASGLYLPLSAQQKPIETLTNQFTRTGV